MLYKYTYRFDLCPLSTSRRESGIQQVKSEQRDRNWRPSFSPWWFWLYCQCCRTSPWGQEGPYTPHHPYTAACGTTTSELQWRLEQKMKKSQWVETTINRNTTFSSAVMQERCPWCWSAVNCWEAIGSAPWTALFRSDVGCPQTLLSSCWWWVFFFFFCWFVWLFVFTKLNRNETIRNTL